MRSIDKIPASVGVLIGVAMVLAGILLGYLVFPNFTGSTAANSMALSSAVDAAQGNTLSAASSQGEALSTTDGESQDGEALQQSSEASADGADPLEGDSNSAASTSSTASESGAANGQDSQASIQQAASHSLQDASRVIQITYSSTPPMGIQDWVNSHSSLIFVSIADVNPNAPNVHIGADRRNGIPVFKQTFAAATRFNTLETDISLTQIKAIWRGTTATLAIDNQPAFTKIAVMQENVPALTALLGTPSAAVEFVTSTDGLSEATKQIDATLLIVPFTKLVPSWKVLAVNGQNPVENVNKYNHTAYPLKANYYLRWQGFARSDQPMLNALINSVPETDRDPSKLTVLAMTGVTAMVRGTAAQMDRFGGTWAADVVGPELASADITHISNEVPFVEDCVTNTSPSNLLFCSKLWYMDTLKACGVDIIGLTGNHQNDYGREDALKSLEFYAQHNLPVYGGGKDREAANAPLYVEHNGNRLAFLGANSYGPNFAWATDERPGSAKFDLNIMSANIRAVKEGNLADVVFAELQYQETYHVMPLIEQRIDFNALLRAGADVVTGVQSHVPQAIEFTDGKMILFGLGNLFFDQMYSQPTREGLIVKHTIYDGRHISTQLLTTMIHDFGQPNWTTPVERELLLNRVFQASYWE